MTILQQTRRMGGIAEIGMLHGAFKDARPAARQICGSIPVGTAATLVT